MMSDRGLRAFQFNARKAHWQDANGVSYRLLVEEKDEKDIEVARSACAFSVSKAAAEQISVQFCYLSSRGLRASVFPSPGETVTLHHRSNPDVKLSFQVGEIFCGRAKAVYAIGALFPVQ
jgi:hypothetical protein